jgi:hypothetical protein
MKTYTKTKSNSFQHVTIEDESGLETFAVRKNLFFAQLASHLRQISTTVTPVKAIV